MKLVEILARELEVWPSYVVRIVQDDNGLIKYDGGDNPKMGSSGCVWIRSKVAGTLESDFLASDWEKSIVTRADWEAERAKLKAPKANRDGWIRHRGGKCPVGAGVLVDIKARDGQVWKAQDPVKQCEWRHDGDGLDIMRYRIHKPAEQPDEHDLTSLAEKAGIKRMAAVAREVIITSGPLEWRDRIHELDAHRAEVESTYQRQISEITQERESLVQKLAVEGLALVEVVNV